MVIKKKKYIQCERGIESKSDFWDHGRIHGYTTIR